MEALTKKYPEDVEAKIFYALALNETFDHKSMEPLRRRSRSSSRSTRNIPTIRASRTISSTATTSRRSRSAGGGGQQVREDRTCCAPCAAHAVAHLLDGRKWQDSISSNLRSVKVANDDAAANKMDGVLAGVPHA